MSLIKQLWLAILVATIIGFGGSLVVSALSARHYLQQELQVKNNDNAAVLAMSLTQLPKDPVTVDLQVAAQFDAGHYRFIRIVSPTGEMLAERVFSGVAPSAPAWFVWLFPIQAPPGQAQVQDGWKQFGTVSVATHEQFAYKSLWDGALQLFLWFLLGGLITGLAGNLVLRLITKPLRDVVQQAEGISQRRFIHIPEPRTPELRSVARAMNSMVERLVVMFSEEAERLDSLRQRVHLDRLSGLADRLHFLSLLRDLLASEQSATQGTLLTVRLTDLKQLNHVLGGGRTDTMIQELGEQLRQAEAAHPDQVAGRLKGGEFALVWPGVVSVEDAAKELHERLVTQWLPRWSPEIPSLFDLAAVPFVHGEEPQELFARTEEALAYAAARGANSWYATRTEDKESTRSSLQWRRLLRKAVRRGRLQLAFYPVVDAREGTLLHREGMVRLQADAEDSGKLLTAGEFMPMAEHLNLIASIDLQTARLAIEKLGEMDGMVAINLSAATIADFGFRHDFMQLLQAHPDRAARLMIEVPEHGVFRQFDAFRDLVQSVKPLGCRVGIEYFGHHFAESHKLVAVALDYIKVHPGYVRDIAGQPQSQEFLQGMCRMAHHLGIVMIALGVESEADLPLLASLGFDGVTGPAIKAAKPAAG